MKKLLILLFAVTAGLAVQAQTAEEVIANYHEVIGGAENISKITNSISTGKVLQGGMEIPFKAITQADGKLLVEAEVQGMKFVPQAFDGETMWGVNFMTQKAEKVPAEQTAEYKANIGQFPDPFLNLSEKGWSVSLIGDEEVDGTECHKIELKMNPVSIEGEEKDVIAHYYFDKESGVILKSTSYNLSGEMKGMAIDTYLSDYEEVAGVYMPMTTTQKINGQEFMSMNMETIEVNQEIDQSNFAFPEESTPEEK